MRSGRRGAARGERGDSGYHIEYGGGMGMPGYGFGFGMQNLNGRYPGRDGTQKPGGGYGASLKDDIRYFYGANFWMDGRGEAIAREDNYCEIDPNTVDKYGIPVLRFNYTWTDHEINQAEHMQETFQENGHHLGAVVGPSPGKENNYGLTQPGQIIHEVGTVRMGNDPKRSALNKYNQAHGCKNLFVVDGGPFGISRCIACSGFPCVNLANVDRRSRSEDEYSAARWF